MQRDGGGERAASSCVRVALRRRCGGVAAVWRLRGGSVAAALGRRWGGVGAA